jgi:exopolysaccharide production protein ExoQ
MNRRGISAHHAVVEPWPVQQVPQRILSSAALWAIRLALVVNTMLSIGNFNERLLPAGLGTIQQLISIPLWLLTIYASFLCRPAQRMVALPGFTLIWLFYWFAAASVLWGSYSGPSMLKALALLITVFGVYRLMLVLSVRTFVADVMTGLFLLSVISVFFALLIPDIGRLKTWQHDGQWSGVFESKQTLGAGSAILVFLALQQYLRGEQKIYCAVAVLFGLACVVGSGSRGGGALAVGAIFTSYFARRSARVQQALAYGPMFMMAIACLQIAYIVLTENRYIPFFGTKLDFTERAYIWQFALRHFHEYPLFGYGLNGFWSREQLTADYNHEHGWVLDNYHSGYITIAMELGLVGFALFAAGMWAWARRMNSAARLRSIYDDAFTVSFVNLIFFIDFTETFFLRSTNIVAVVFVGLMFASYGQTSVPGRSGLRAAGSRVPASPLASATPTRLPPRRTPLRSQRL